MTIVTIHSRLGTLSAFVAFASACGEQVGDDSMVSHTSSAHTQVALDNCQREQVNLQATLSSAQTALATTKAHADELEQKNASLTKELDAVKASLADARRLTTVSPTPPSNPSETTTRDEPSPAPAPTSYDAKMFASPRLKFDVLYLGEKLSVTVSSVNWRATRWAMDRRGSEWSELQPTKGNYLVTFDFSVTTNSKDPRLPAFYVAQMKDGFPTYVGVAKVEFYKWEDYGSYLGNYADYGNDFSRSTTVRFTAGREIPMSLAKEALFLVATKSPCMKRQYDRFGNPPTSYSTFDCPMSALRKPPHEFWSEHALVAVLNAKQLFPK